MFNIADCEFFRYNVEGYPSTFPTQESQEILPTYSISKIAPYFYRADYSDINYELAYQYFNEQGDFQSIGACSALRKGNLLGRQLDWTYNNDAEFVVYTPRKDRRNAVLGVAGALDSLTEEIVMSGFDNGMYQIMPFRLQDGINEHGVFAETNVVPADKGFNVSIPYVIEKERISAHMLVRYILDHFATARAAVEYIKNYVSVYFPRVWHDMHYEAHYLIGDLTDTFCLEFVNNRANIIDFSTDQMFLNKPYMTNFHLSGVLLNSNSSVYTPETRDSTHSAGGTNLITPNGSGLERYNLINANYNSVTDHDSMRSLLNQLTYTRTYITADDVSNPFWYSEYVGVNDLTVDSEPEEFEAVVEYVGSVFEHRTRTDEITTWQTTHSSIYDLQNKTLHVIPQESGIEYTFSLGG